MAKQYDNNMTGIISRNDRKEKDTHADIKGKCEIDGTEYYIDGWQKQRKDGSGSFYSLSFKRVDGANVPASSVANSEDIPF
jgi:hypothetical protein